MNVRLFETAQGIAEPWRVTIVDLDAPAKSLTIGIDFPFDKYHVIARASRALDETRRIEQKTTPGSRVCAGSCCEITEVSATPVA